MKVLVFAHTPPPHHGQSQMVQYMVDGFRANPSMGIEVVIADPGPCMQGRFGLIGTGFGPRFLWAGSRLTSG